MVYPTLLAAIGDVAHPRWRASAVGVYRLWRDLGYAVGAVLAGLVADAFGLAAALWLVAALTLALGPPGRAAHAGDAWARDDEVRVMRALLTHIGGRRWWRSSGSGEASRTRSWSSAST
jgi:MFS family permease